MGVPGLDATEIGASLLLLSQVPFRSSPAYPWACDLPACFLWTIWGVFLPIHDEVKDLWGRMFSTSTLNGESFFRLFRIHRS